MSNNVYEDAVAIVGMDARFAGLSTKADFWDLLMSGKSAEKHFSQEELRARGVSDSLLQRSEYVFTGMPFSEVGAFDGEIFGFDKRMADRLDPQVRLLLECVWHAFENAGLNPLLIGRQRMVGVFAGKNPSEYWQHNLDCLQHRSLADENLAAQLELSIGNGQDFTANWIAYKFGLRGPVYNVQTACSTGLSALVLGVQNLLLYSCDIAVVGAAGLCFPMDRGYLYQPEGIYSRDGLCRPFDAKASGTINGNGIVSYILKRYEDAIADGNRIEAIIVGTGTSNDGNLKQDFMAPGIQGQVQAMRAALQMAGLKANDIDYIEAHGTGTKLGDPVEAAAIAQAYACNDVRTRPCIVGSVKSNVGHLNACAGLAGLYKVILALQHKQIPPTAHFQQINPLINWTNDTFQVTSQPIDWPQKPNRPRRAGISSLGFGGTNVHIIVEEAPQLIDPPSDSKKPQAIPLLFSANSSEQVQTLASSTAAALNEAVIADKHLRIRAAYTLLHGRARLPWRVACAASPSSGAIQIVGPPHLAVPHPQSCWLFTGQIGQFAGAGKQLLAYVAYKQAVDHCAAILQDRFLAIEEVLHEGWSKTQPIPAGYLQPALFIHQYALSQLWLSLGIKPSAVVGHSFGEIAAFCIAGSLSLEQALRLVVCRGEAIDRSVPPDGAMLAVLCEENKLPNLQGISLACRNTKHIQIVAGKATQIQTYQTTCRNQQLSSVLLTTDRAYHSPWMQTAIRPLMQTLKFLEIRDPAVSLFSSLTGNKVDHAPQLDYWLKQLTSPVEFLSAIESIEENISPTVYLEIGAQSVLTPMVHNITGKPTIATSNRPVSEEIDFINAICRLFESGFDIDGNKLGLCGPAIELPGYPFSNVHHWIDEGPHQGFLKAQNNNNLMCESRVPCDDLMKDLLQVILNYWQEYLGVHDISPNTDFFSLNGSSLAALQIRQRLHQDLGVSVDMASFMSARTPQRLVHLICDLLQKGVIHD